MTAIHHNGRIDETGIMFPAADGFPLAGAFRTWRRWLHKGDYLMGELADRLKPNCCNDIRAPIVFCVFSADPLTTAESAQKLLTGMPNARTEFHVLRPSDLGVRALGHQNLFRRKNEAAWPKIWDAAI
ncbi:MAG: hypothetical protein KBE00_03045 [Syntrophaceae bacterium]|nr:hypothetical protein [Syntrophaceae bacterium]